MSDLSITGQLFALQDIEYKQFHSKLMPTINPDVIIGVRTPELRKLAKQLAVYRCRTVSSTASAPLLRGE